MRTSQTFNKEFIARYYPNSEDKHNNQLVGFTKMKQIVGNIIIFARMMDRVARMKGDKLTHKLQRGSSFQFVRR